MFYSRAANYTSITAPNKLSEWDFSGLTPLPSKIVKPAHVKESAFSVEVKLHQYIPIHSGEKDADGKETDYTKGNHTNDVYLLRGVYVHAREDIFDEFQEDNKDGNGIDERKFSNVNWQKLKPVSRLGGVRYGRSTQVYDLPKFDFNEESNKHPNFYEPFL